MNREVYEVGQDDLLYDSSHQRDASNVNLKVPAGKAGTLKKGQIIDFVASTKEYESHVESGSASCILTQDTEYAADDTTVVATVYISGSFRKSKVVTDVALTDVDIETLRSKGIYLK